MKAAHWRPSPLTREALAIALVTRAGLAFIAWLSLRALPRLGLHPAQLPDFFLPSHPALDAWTRWDTSHYVAVAQFGYGYPVSPSPHGGAGFFPLYPLLMRSLVEITRVAVTPGALAVAGLIIANLSFLLAVPLLARLTADHLGEDAGRQAALLLCVAPFGFFFNAAYSESLFMAISLGALLLARRNRFGLAAILAALGSATRLVGLALLPALLVLAWRRKAPLRDVVAILFISPLGTVAYGAYLAWTVGDPFAYFRAQVTWGDWNDHVRFYVSLFLFHPRDTLFGDPRHLIIVLNVAVGLVFLTLLPRVWRLLDPGTALFTTLLVVVQGAATWVSLGRYLLPAVGVWIVAGALITRPGWSGWPRDIIVATSALLLAALTVLFGHGFWVV
ncbi:MAG: mannosyltransferase family protein [Thermomicrobiales bacterium]